MTMSIYYASGPSQRAHFSKHHASVSTNIFAFRFSFALLPPIYRHFDLHFHRLQVRHKHISFPHSPSKCHAAERVHHFYLFVVCGVLMFVSTFLFSCYSSCEINTYCMTCRRSQIDNLHKIPVIRRMLSFFLC